MKHASKAQSRKKPSKKAVMEARGALARRIIAERERLGVLQKHLAWRAGVAVETLNRIEQERVTATPATLAKIDNAIAEYRRQAGEKTG